MKLGKLVRSTIERLYTDRFTAYRYVEQENADKTTQMNLSPVPTIVDQKCRISFVPNRQENPKDSETDANPILTQPKLFCAPNLGLIAGDYVTAERLGDDGEVLATYSGPIGLPFLYPSHVEVQIGEVEKA